MACGRPCLAHPGPAGAVRAEPPLGRGESCLSVSGAAGCRVGFQAEVHQHCVHPPRSPAQKGLKAATVLTGSWALGRMRQGRGPWQQPAGGSIAQGKVLRAPVGVGLPLRQPQGCIRVPLGPQASHLSHLALSQPPPPLPSRNGLSAPRGCPVLKPGAGASSRGG